MENQKLSLKERVKLFKNESVSFIENKTKGELLELVKKEITINNVGFLKGTDGEYAVFTIKEYPDKFYFASSVITSNLKELVEEGYLEDIKNEGLKCKIDMRVSQNKRKYYTIEYI